MKKHTCHLLLSSLLLFAHAGQGKAAASPNTSTLPPRIRQVAEAYLDTELTSGMTLIYIEGDKAPAIVSLGNTDYKGRGFPITPDSRFEIGSLTKLFTGLLVAKCVSAKACDLQQSIQDLSPGTILSKDLQNTRLIELLTHSSGLPALPSNFEPQNPEDPYADYNETLLKAYLQEATTEDKGTHRYSNIGFGLLGYLMVQHLTPGSEKNDLQQLMHNNILAPLGMTSASFDDLESLKLAVLPHQEGDQSQRWHFQDTTAGAGALRASGQDMARFLAASMPPELIREPALRQAMKESQRVLRSESQLKSPVAVAYAWHRYPVLGKAVMGHSGQTGGFVSFIGFDSERKRGAVILSNDTTDVSPLGLAMVMPSFPLSPPKDQRQAEAVLQPYVGTYELTPDFSIQVTQRRGYLYVQGTGQAALKIIPDSTSPDRFNVEGVKASIRFERNTKGMINGLILDQDNIQQKAPRITEKK